MHLPKAELHLHIEGTLEPELAFALAERNGVTLPYATTDELRAAYQFDDLQSFLDLYYALMAVLRTEDDFTELADAYLARAAAQGVRHAEIFFDPQAHTARGVPIGTVIEGLGRALERSEETHGVSTQLILCFLRDLSAESALGTLDAAKPYLHRISAIGLDSAEVGHPPAKFRAVYEAATALGLRKVAHAGEEARRSTSGRPWTSSASSASTTGCAAWRTRSWWRAWSRTGCRSRSARSPTSGCGRSTGSPTTRCRG
ncbi:Adenine deaminase [Streptomyces badius]